MRIQIIIDLDDVNDIKTNITKIDDDTKKSIETLGLNNRVYYTLKRGGIETIADLIEAYKKTMDGWRVRDDED